MTKTFGRSLELYYIDGRPEGMVAAELFNWTGHVLLAPRTQIAAALARSEAGYTGVYLLLGEQNGAPCAYVGESDNISARIRTHDVKKEWWTSLVVVTTAANKLNKAHVRYLEARLIAEAHSIGQVVLDNATKPPTPTLSEADIAKMEAFLDNLRIVLPAVRVDMFIERSRPSPDLGLIDKSRAGQQALEFPKAVHFALETPLHKLSAKATLIDSEFIVTAGSLARLDWEGVNSGESTYGKLYAELRRSEVIVPDGKRCQFARHYAFRSPSAAASVINGRPTNGQLAWKEVDTGLTYKDWEAKQLTP